MLSRNSARSFDGRINIGMFVDYMNGHDFLAMTGSAVIFSISTTDLVHTHELFSEPGSCFPESDDNKKIEKPRKETREERKQRIKDEEEYNSYFSGIN